MFLFVFVWRILRDVRLHQNSILTEGLQDALDKIDQADRKIEEASAKAKSGISSWFGGK
jgi:hypothetical protein